MIYLRYILYALLATSLLKACDGSNSSSETATSDLTMEVNFQAFVGAEAFSCDQSYGNIGLSNSSIQARYLRMFIYNPKLIAADGSRIDFRLEQDQRWQRDRVALIDFDDASGLCDSASPDTNRSLRGTAPAGDYTGFEFEIGLPAELNHLNAATEPAPYNETGMWWTWKGGYKFMRFDFKTTAQENFYFHLGATACQGTLEEGFNCAYQNLPKISLTDFNPAEQGIVLDLKTLFASSDLDTDADPTTGSNVKGCMSFAGDPECVPLFQVLGLNFMADEAGPPQTLFQAK